MAGRRGGFTLIELLVVMAIIATLLTIALPRYFQSVQKSKEAVLKENLYQMRDALQKFYADRGKYPESIDELATQRYLRAVPVDPVTESKATWIAVAPEDPKAGAVEDVRSGAPGTASSGEPYGQW